MKHRMRIGITMGDAAGIGPEVIIKALERKNIYKNCIPVVIGDYEALEDAVRFCGSPLVLEEVPAVSLAKGTYGTVEYINLGHLAPQGWEYKKASALCGDAAFHYITRGIEMAMQGEISAVITAPINKEAINMAGYDYSGHTEIFAEYTNTKDYAMLLACGSLRVIHVTTHCSLREACNRIKMARVLKVIQLANLGAKQFGIPVPRIAVAGLNPHSSENSMFGSEERDEIIPAILDAKNQGICVDGPIAPDTVFVKCQGGQYDIVVAMYHDQGHIPLKLSGFNLDSKTNRFTNVSGVNCTIGLPIIRVSVDHGTAFGKAGDGLANEESMVDAILTGIKMAEYKLRSEGRRAE